MKTLSLADAKARLSEVVTAAERQKERVIIEKRKKPVAVVVGMTTIKSLKRLDSPMQKTQAGLYENTLFAEVGILGLRLPIWDL
ncbi:MAG: type II toxin-antitoxin system Phd/YefM family antitoxin [Candidatus Brocadia sp.]|nr:type II toxin-antitoxin system Phd/YefM family antitoxin [Candidatus Brocadia sp.]